MHTTVCSHAKLSRLSRAYAQARQTSSHPCVSKSQPLPVFHATYDQCPHQTGMQQMGQGAYTAGTCCKKPRSLELEPASLLALLDRARTGELLDRHAGMTAVRNLMLQTGTKCASTSLPIHSQPQLDSLTHKTPPPPLFLPPGRPRAAVTGSTQMKLP